MSSVLVAHPSPDVYGSDLQLIESVVGLREAGWEVTVSLPRDGPLSARLVDAGAFIRIDQVPVLRRSVLGPVGLLRLAFALPPALRRMVRAIRSSRAEVVYVNTVTIPWWLLAARLCRLPVLCHVHEAEDAASRPVRTGLAAPLLLAATVIANSRASERALLDVLPRLRNRTTVIENGVAGTPEPTDSRGEPGRLALVARLSPRKGIDVALEAVALLRAQDREVHLDVCGSIFAGYEWFETELRTRAAQPDLAGAIEFRGYVNPTWPVLAAAEVVLVPSRAEPFGNAAVEGLLAERPVVASGVQGLAEIIDDGRTGLLVAPDDPSALAVAIARLLDDPEMADRLAADGRHEAVERFSTDRYRRAVAAAVQGLVTKR